VCGLVIFGLEMFPASSTSLVFRSSTALMNGPRNDDRFRICAGCNRVFARNIVRITGGSVKGADSHAAASGVRDVCHVHESAGKVQRERFLPSGEAYVRGVDQTGKGACVRVKAHRRNIAAGIHGIDELAQPIGGHRHAGVTQVRAVTFKR